MNQFLYFFGTMKHLIEYPLLIVFSKKIDRFLSTQKVRTLIKNTNKWQCRSFLYEILNTERIFAEDKVNEYINVSSWLRIQFEGFTETLIFLANIIFYSLSVHDGRDIIIPFKSSGEKFVDVFRFFLLFTFPSYKSQSDPLTCSFCTDEDEALRLLNKKYSYINLLVCSIQ